MGAVAVTSASRCSISSLVRSNSRPLSLGIDRPLGQHVLFQGVEPAVEDVAQGALGRVGGGQPLHQPPVDRLQPVQRRLGLRDLDLGRGEPDLLRPVLPASGRKTSCRSRTRRAPP